MPGNVAGWPLTGRQLRLDDPTVPERDDDHGVLTASEVGSLPDTQEGRADGRLSRSETAGETVSHHVPGDPFEGL